MQFKGSRRESRLSCSLEHLYNGLINSFLNMGITWERFISGII